jgi:hypothetical protein
MICSTCNKDSIVTDTRLVDGVRYRRRKCECQKSWITSEVLFDGPWPYKDPRVRTGRYKPKPKVKVKGKPKPAKTKKEYLPVFQPAMQEWNLVVTKQSPLWLKNIAMQLQ